MEIHWAQGELPEKITSGIFLAGPTPRSKDVKSWRPQALKILEEVVKFEGDVFIPEFEGWTFDGTYAGQIEWERKALQLAHCIVFWVPRDLETMPAFTTNIEFGEWHSSGKVVLGYPPETPKMKYFAHLAKEENIPQADTLTETLANAVEMTEQQAKDYAQIASAE